MLGDHLFHSNTNIPCITQLINVYEQSESLTIGLFELSLNDVPNYGIAKIKDETPNRLHLSALIEKPSKDHAASELAYKGKYYGMFTYIITPQVYEELSKNLSSYDPNHGELDLTPALDAVVRNHGAAGVILNGTRYDIGMPEQYRQTVTYFDSLKTKTASHSDFV